MRDYIIRRLMLGIPTLFIGTAIAFLVSRIMPGDVIDLMIAEHESEYEQYTQVELDREGLMHELGLDVPVHVQYFRWIGGIVLHGDFGNSLWRGTPILDDYLERMPVSFELGVIAQAGMLMFGLPLGIYAAIRQDSFMDYGARSIAIAMGAIPSLWLATMIVVFPSIWWNWSPPMEYKPLWVDPWQNLQMFLIPGFIMGALHCGGLIRMVRTLMLETMRQDYIRTAWSKGLTERVVVLRHGIRNAAIPLITMFGGMIPRLIGGAVIMEQIFCIPGMGRLMLASVRDRDYPVFTGINFIGACIGMVNILMVDLSYAWLDPRIRLEKFM